MRPSAQTSVAGAISWPGPVCSGAIQMGVPIVPVFCEMTSEVTLAMPKSRTFTVKGTSPAVRGKATKMFSGLRSR